MKKKLILAVLVILFLGMWVAPEGFSAEKVYRIRIGDITPPDNPLDQAFERMAAEMNEKSKGVIQAKVYPSSQLGNLRSMTEAVQMGTLEMAVQSSGGQASFYAPMGVMELPFTYKSHKHVYKVVDGPIGQELGEQFRQKTGIRIVAYFMNLYRHTTNNLRPIRVPADLKGLKIRVPEFITIKMAIEAAGGNPVPMSMGEVYTALQQKMIDGQENPISVIWAAKLYEVQKFLSLTGHAYSPTNIMINDKFYQSLPADLQKIIADAAQKAGAWNRDYAEKLEVELVGKLKEKGMQVNEVEQEPFKKLMVTVWDDFTSKTPESKKYLDQILKVE